MAPNVNLNASDTNRAQALEKILVEVSGRLDEVATAAHAVRFMRHIAWHESRGCKTRVQDADGPARGFPQFEAHRARDTLEYAFDKRNSKPFWRILMDAARVADPTVTDEVLETHWRALPAYGQPNAPKFPANNLVERLLVTDDAFGATLMRVALKKLPGALPQSLGEDPERWAADWKRVNVTPQEKRNFLSRAIEVDRLLDVHPAPFEVLKSTEEVPWLVVALGELGVKEISGSKSNARINTYLASVGVEPDDETAWCSAFVNWVMERSGHAGTGSARARSWQDYGKDAGEPARGAIVVFWRDSPQSWKGHVGFVIGVSGDEVLVLGGNQDNRVCYKSYPRERVLAWRWPNDE